MDKLSVIFNSNTRNSIGNTLANQQMGECSCNNTIKSNDAESKFSGYSYSQQAKIKRSTRKASQKAIKRNLYTERKYVEQRGSSNNGLRNLQLQNILGNRQLESMKKLHQLYAKNG